MRILRASFTQMIALGKNESDCRKSRRAIIVLFFFWKVLEWNQAWVLLSFIIPNRAIFPTSCKPSRSPNLMNIPGKRFLQRFQLFRNRNIFVIKRGRYIVHWLCVFR